MLPMIPTMALPVVVVHLIIVGACLVVTTTNNDLVLNLSNGVALVKVEQIWPWCRFFSTL